MQTVTLPNQSVQSPIHENSMVCTLNGLENKIIVYSKSYETHDDDDHDDHDHHHQHLTV